MRSSFSKTLSNIHVLVFPFPCQSQKNISIRNRASSGALEYGKLLAVCYSLLLLVVCCCCSLFIACYSLMFVIYKGRPPPPQLLTNFPHASATPSKRGNQFVIGPDRWQRRGYNYNLNLLVIQHLLSVIAFSIHLCQHRPSIIVFPLQNCWHLQGVAHPTFQIVNNCKDLHTGPSKLMRFARICTPNLPNWWQLQGFAHQTFQIDYNCKDLHTRPSKLWTIVMIYTPDLPNC